MSFFDGFSPFGGGGGGGGGGLLGGLFSGGGPIGTLGRGLPLIGGALSGGGGGGGNASDSPFERGLKTAGRVLFDPAGVFSGLFGDGESARERDLRRSAHLRKYGPSVGPLGVPGGAERTDEDRARDVSNQGGERNNPMSSPFGVGFQGWNPPTMSDVRPLPPPQLRAIRRGPPQLSAVTGKGPTTGNRRTGWT